MAVLDDAPRLGEPVTITFPDLLGSAGVSRHDGVATLGILVGGTWRESSEGAVFDIRSPIDGSVIARAQRAGKDDVNAAIAAARTARPMFRRIPAAERLEICERAAHIMEDHLAAFVEVIVADLAKTPAQARSEAVATPPPTVSATSRSAAPSPTPVSGYSIDECTRIKTVVLPT